MKFAVLKNDRYKRILFKYNEDRRMNMPIFGCVADDFTGASDAASFLEKGGLSVQLFNGIPEGDSPVLSGIQAVVIALKSRTQNREDAVRDSLKSLNWLKAHGVKQFYLKYCSTFDSTPDGISVLWLMRPWIFCRCLIPFCVRPCRLMGVRYFMENYM